MKPNLINAQNIVNKATYDNKGAHDTIKNLMENKAILRIKFIADREGYLAAMIETAKIGGFKYRLNEKNFEWLWKYITEGAVEDFGIDPMDVQRDEEAEDFQETLLRQIVLGKESGDYKGQLQVTPIFRETSGKVTATAAMRKGKVTFSIKRTTELLDYLREYNYIA